MRVLSGPLAALLNSNRQIVFADLYTFIYGSLNTPSYLRYTDRDQTLAYGGNTFTRGPLIKRDRVRFSVGVEVDTLSLLLSADPSVQVNSQALMTFIASGGLDGARLRVERVFGADWSVAPVGSILLFAGRINEIDMDRHEAKISVVSDLELLNVNVPANLYQSGCANTLYDGTCTVSRAAYTVGGTITGTPTKSAFGTTVTVSPALPEGYYELGVVTFTSGNNNGVSRTVKTYVNATGAITVIAPLPFAPVAGDTFTIYPGCDKTKTTCVNKFSNVQHFRGFPWIPVPETVA